MSERELYQQIIEYLTVKGCFVWRNSTGARGRYRFGKKGAADILGLTPSGRMIAIECKSDKGISTTEQLEFAHGIITHNGIYFIARNLDEIIIKYREKAE